MGKCGIALRAHIRSSKWYYTAGVGDIQSHPNRSAAYTIPNRKQYTPGKFHILDIHTPLESPMPPEAMKESFKFLTGPHTSGALDTNAGQPW